jgi:hypothetical protein
MPNTIALCAVVLTLIALLSGGRAHIETEHPGWNNVNKIF